ncbi:MAG: hypothetical protein ABIP20_11600 [Chthoniobacteraceae bacterium]
MHDFRSDGTRFPFVNWSAILGGTILAMGVHFFLGTLRVGASLAVFYPLTDAHPAENFSLGAAVVCSVCALVALYCGGVLAGRYSHSLHGGFVHGILVWSITLIIALTFASIGTGTILGGALKVLGQGAAMTGQAAAAGAGQVLKHAAKRTDTQTGSFIDESVQAMPAGSPQRATRAKREIGFAVVRHFAPGNDVNSPEHRRAAIQSLTTYAGMNEADATKTVDDWTTFYRNLQAELAAIQGRADEQARIVADEAASHLSAAALWSFVGLLLGLLVSALGGTVGARSAVFHHGGVR